MRVYCACDCYIWELSRRRSEGINRGNSNNSARNLAANFSRAYTHASRRLEAAQLDWTPPREIGSPVRRLFFFFFLITKQGTREFGDSISRARILPRSKPENAQGAQVQSTSMFLRSNITSFLIADTFPVSLHINIRETNNLICAEIKFPFQSFW